MILDQTVLLAGLFVHRAIGRALQLDRISGWLFDFAGLPAVPCSWVRCLGFAIRWATDCATLLDKVTGWVL